MNRLRRLLIAWLTPGSGLDLIADERERQLRVEGWTDTHDDTHTDGSLATVAACYAAPQQIYVLRREPHLEKWYVDAWPRTWHSSRDKRDTLRAATPKTPLGMKMRLRELAKAGALIASEIDRLQREEVRRSLDARNASRHSARPSLSVDLQGAGL